MKSLKRSAVSVIAASVLLTGCSSNENPANVTNNPASVNSVTTPQPSGNGNSAAAVESKPTVSSSATSQGNTNTIEYVTDMIYSYNGFKGTYTGGWLGSGPRGQGTFKSDENGAYFMASGNWERLTLNGEGTMEWEEEIKKGTFKDGRLNGQGYRKWIQKNDTFDEIFLLSGEYKEGRLVDGKFTYEQKTEKSSYMEVFEGTFDETENLYTGTYEIYSNGKKKESGVYVKGKKTKS